MFTWSKDLETGNTLIDTEHKELIQAINRLLEACAKGHGRDTIESTLKFLSDYITTHFAHEEALQLKTKYTDYQNHKQYHEGFKTVVKNIVMEFNKDGATIGLVGKVNSSIGDWLIRHIKREDVKVAAHVKQFEQGL